MRLKFTILAAAALFAVLAIAPAANAASSSIFVTTKLSARADICRPSADALSYKLVFTASIKRRNSPKPKSVRVSVRIVNAATGELYATRVATLTPKNKFKNATQSFTVPLGVPLTYNVISTYKAPRTGKKIRAKGAFSDAIPTAEEIDAANAANPTAPPFPACI